MSERITIFGGNGFVGRYIAQRMAAQGWQVRLASRSGAVPTMDGAVEGVQASILDAAQVQRAAEGAAAIVNCVGTFDARGANNFQAIQAEGAARIAEAAAAAGAQHMVHLSAIGADAGGASTYAQTKAAGEAGVLKNMPGATVLRPSVIFGPEDQFFNRFAGMALMGPAVPVVGANTLFQPVYVDDVAAAAEAALLGKTPGIYELGGPDVASFHDLMVMMLGVIERKRLVLDIPVWAGGIMAAGADLGHRATGGLLPMPITPDQVKSLRSDNIVTNGAKTFADLGLQPRAMEEILPSYLSQYRPKRAA